MALIDNGDVEAKVLVRTEALGLVGPGAKVLDCYAGEGHMYAAVWGKGTSQYLGIERRFARQKGHPNGQCWRGDNQVMLPRAMAAADWNIVDLDAYGNPWPLARQLFRLAKQPRLVLTVTDGTKRGLAGKPAAHEFSALVAGAARLSYSGLLMRWKDDITRWSIEWATGGRWTAVKAKFADSQTPGPGLHPRYWLFEFQKKTSNSE